MQVIAESHLEQAESNQAKPGLKSRGQVVYLHIKLSRTFVIQQQQWVGTAATCGQAASERRGVTQNNFVDLWTGK